MLDLATEGEDDDDDDSGNAMCARTTPRLLSASFRSQLCCNSYCCACSVIDALARKTPARVMWPLVKDFISSKVAATHPSLAPAGHRTAAIPFFFKPFSRFKARVQAVSSDVYDRRGSLAVLRSTAEGLCEAMRSSAEGLMRCALQGLADPDPRVVNEGTSNAQMWKGKTPNFFKKVSSASANLPRTCHQIPSAVRRLV
jgi:hypothetical protein